MSKEDVKDNTRGHLNKTAIFIQNACLQHQYIRSKDLSNIVERPERLRAVNIGLAAAVARLGELFEAHNASKGKDKETTPGPDDLAHALNKLNLDVSSSREYPVKIVQSQSILDIMTHPAVKFVHGDIERDVYLENLSAWVRDSANKIADGGSEIPEGYPQGDLYCKSYFMVIFYY